MSRPGDDFTQEYNEWLANGISNRTRIETAQISHSTFPTQYLANWQEDITKTLNDVSGTPSQVFTAARFIHDPAALGQSTEQSCNIAISSYGGQLYDYMMSMTMEERNDPITVVLREYLDNSDNQLVNPAPVWTVHNANVAIDAVSFELRADPLRVRRTGRYYTALDFPILTVLR